MTVRSAPEISSEPVPEMTAVEATFEELATILVNEVVPLTIETVGATAPPPVPWRS